MQFKDVEMQAGGNEELKGRRVLVVEDEVLVAMDYCQNLEDADPRS
jgi:hypothetical protein